MGQTATGICERPQSFEADTWSGLRWLQRRAATSMRNVSKLLFLIVVVTVAIWWGRSGQRVPRNQVGQGGVAEDRHVFAPVPRQPLPGADETYHGLAWQIHQSRDCVSQARRLLGQIADLGADTVLISNAGYQEHAGSESFQIDPAVTPSPEQWQQIFDVAHGNGLRVILMPIILLSDPRGNEWRGVISPPNWDDWMEQYLQFLLHFARIAAKGKVEVLMVGSELVSAEKHVRVDQWRRLIREVRKVFPGKLSYSSNWDHYKVVTFWDELDLIGMTSYYKLSADPKPSMESLVEAWKPIKRGLLRWRQTVGKPILFTEAGWCSQEGTSIYPWDYYYNQEATSAGHEEQRRCYRAFIDTWKDVPTSEVGGIVWWEWNDSPGGLDDYNYTPKGKPAEVELRNWFAVVRERRAAVRTVSK